MRSEREFHTREDAHVYIESELGTLSNPDTVGLWWAATERGSYRFDDPGDLVWMSDDVGVIAYLKDDGRIDWNNTH